MKKLNVNIVVNPQPLDQDQDPGKRLTMYSH